MPEVHFNCKFLDELAKQAYAERETRQYAHTANSWYKDEPVNSAEFFRSGTRPFMPGVYITVYDVETNQPMQMVVSHRLREIIRTRPPGL